MTPRQEFNDLWGVTVKLESINVFASKKDFVWRADMVSINKSPEQRRRRIPFDFQRTSLAGLVLESATSSGLGRAPIQAPPGTTRQAGLYTS
ncbi:hypothetical protein TNCV_4870861 [Trichonephila clavipes]|nr:hypothetical protein TNCV_4870861 [Trichonephila clavipes]